MGLASPAHDDEVDRWMIVWWFDDDGDVNNDENDKIDEFRIKVNGWMISD
jgi:hypothetical protein